MQRKELLNYLGFSGLILLILLIVIGLIVVLIPGKTLVQGVIELEEIDVGAKVAGRIGAIYVKEGDGVLIGTPLIRMDSPEIAAKMKQAAGASEAAAAVAAKAQAGARPQEIDMAKQTWQRAQVGSDLAYKTYKRVKNLAKEGLVSQQKLDEAYANYANNRDQAQAAKAQYDMAREGARREDIAAAEAQAKQVSGVVDEATVAAEEANLKSPIAGVVVKVIAKAGEIMPQGTPLITIAKPNDQTLYFNLKETELKNFRVGQEFSASIPALSDKKDLYRFKVTYISPLSDFATWRPTRNSEGFDIRTFEVRAKPVKPIADVRSGMTVLIRY